MIAFEAATPFQIFNCINIYNMTDKSEPADLYLYTYAADLREIAERLRKVCIFENVFIIENVPKAGRIETIAAIFNTKKLIGELEIKEYHTLYISYSGLPNMILYNLLFQKSKSLKLFFYEDGVSSYYNGLFKYAKSIEILRKIRGLRNDSDHVEQVYLYEPRLNKISYANEVKIKKIYPCIEAGMLNKVNDVFGITQSVRNLLSEKEFIYFDHDFRKYVTDEFFFNFSQNEIVNNIANLVGNILIKISPLSNANDTEYYGENIIVSNFERAPWEILIAEDRDIENRCLITICSNAVVTPKTVFGKEPYVLILGKALYNAGATNSSDVWTEDMGKYYNEILSIYSDKKRFCIAETMEDAQLFIKRILNEKLSIGRYNRNE